MSHLVPSLSEPRLKLGRAYEHLATLKDELEAFMSDRPHPYAVVAQKHPDEPICLLRLKVFRPVPVRLGLLVGDFAHNARASLDYLARQLSLLAKPELARLPAKERLVEFPIFLKEPPGGIKTNKGLNFMSDDAKTEIEALQPYKRVAPPGAPWTGPEDDWLWLLYRLVNRDKHRQIAPVGLRVRTTINPDTFTPGVKERVVPFQDGHMLDIFPEELIDNRALKVEPSFDVLFSEAGLAEGIGVEALTQLHDYIRDSVFPRFARFF